VAELLTFLEALCTSGKPILLSCVSRVGSARGFPLFPLEVIGRLEGVEHTDDSQRRRFVVLAEGAEKPVGRVELDERLLVRADFRTDDGNDYFLSFVTMSDFVLKLQDLETES
jgi:hypothetical protein